MLVLDSATGAVTHDMFRQFPDYVREGDLVVFNDSKVFPARLYGERSGGGNLEVLLLRNISGTMWECLAKPGRRLKVGSVLSFGELGAVVREALPDGNKVIEFDCQISDFFAILDRLGVMPLPPYIHEKLSDNARYNTVYARELGSAAAPTAGLHFTADTFAALSASGAETRYVTLNVGLGTFRPVQTDDITAHKMHAESYSVSADTIRAIVDVKERGGRIFAVGTTSARVLESIPDDVLANPRDWSASTDIFIYPPYRFRNVDSLLTNFHLPESTLIMLVSALVGLGTDTGIRTVLSAYNAAVAEEYRFFSFGDCMLVV
jgi:S-adenosylmethionine:tRNA ribosyltransferase-isomerase